MSHQPARNTAAVDATQPSGATSISNNQAVSRRWIEVFNERDDAAEAHVRAPGYVAHAPASLEPAPAELRVVDSVPFGIRQKGSQIFDSRWRTLSRKAISSHSVSTSRAPTPANSRASADPQESLVLRAGAQPLRRWTGRGALVPARHPHASSTARADGCARSALAASHRDSSAQQAAPEGLTTRHHIRRASHGRATEAPCADSGTIAFGFENHRAGDRLGDVPIMRGGRANRRSP